MPVEIDAVSAAYVKWRQANDVAVAMSRAGLPQDQLDELWAIEEEMLVAYTALYATYYEQSEE